MNQQQQILRMDTFPSFTYFDGSNDIDLDFNILSEYLLIDEDHLKQTLSQSADDMRIDAKSSAVVSEQG